MFLSKPAILCQLSSCSICLGDHLVYNCTLNSTVHVWKIPAYDVTEVLGRASNLISLPGNISFMLVEDHINSIVTSLEISLSRTLNGTTISCADGVIEGETQELVVPIVGKLMSFCQCPCNAYLQEV